MKPMEKFMSINCFLVMYFMGFTSTTEYFICRIVIILKSTSQIQKAMSTFSMRIFSRLQINFQSKIKTRHFVIDSFAYQMQNFHNNWLILYLPRVFWCRCLCALSYIANKWCLHFSGGTHRARCLR